MLDRYLAQARKLDRNRDGTSAGRWADTQRGCVRGRLDRYRTHARKLDRNTDGKSAERLGRYREGACAVGWTDIGRNHGNCRIDTPTARAREAGQILGASTGARQEQGQHVRGMPERHTVGACTVSWTDVGCVPRS